MPSPFHRQVITEHQPNPARGVRAEHSAMARLMRRGYIWVHTRTDHRLTGANFRTPLQLQRVQGDATTRQCSSMQRLVSQRETVVALRRGARPLIKSLHACRRARPPSTHEVCSTRRLANANYAFLSYTLSFFLSHSLFLSLSSVHPSLPPVTSTSSRSLAALLSLSPFIRLCPLPPRSLARARARSLSLSLADLASSD